MLKTNFFYQNGNANKRQVQTKNELQQQYASQTQTHMSQQFEGQKSHQIKRAISQKENSYSIIHRKVKSRKQSQDFTEEDIADVSKLDEKIQNILSKNKKLSLILSQSNPSVHSMFSKIVLDKELLQNESPKDSSRQQHEINYKMMKNCVSRLECIIEEKCQDIESWKAQYAQERQRQEETCQNQQDYINYLNEELGQRKQLTDDQGREIQSLKQLMLKQQNQIIFQKGVMKEKQMIENILLKTKSKESFESIDVHKIRQKFEEFQPKQSKQHYVTFGKMSDLEKTTIQQNSLHDQGQPAMLKTMNRLKSCSERLLQQTKQI